MPKVKINDINIYYEIRGEGEPLCLIMGLGGSSIMWYRQRELLSKSYKLILLDNRGVGRSSKSNIPYSMEMLVEDIKGVLDHLNISKLHLMGCSMGGMISQHFAFKYQGMLNSLILCCTTPSIQLQKQSNIKPEDLFIMREVTPESLRKIFSLIFTKRYVDWLFSKQGKEELSNLIAEMSKSPPTMKVMKNQLEAIKNHEVIDRLNEIKIPTLVMVGKDDKLMPPKHSELLAKYLPNAELRILEGGHMFWIEEEKEFAKTVLNFLTNLKR